MSNDVARWRGAGERLATGRRHVRAGSVHVRELISKRPADISGPLAREAAGGPLDAGDLDNLLDRSNQPPNSHRRPPTKAAQVAKIAGLGVASCVLCVSIALGSMITHQRQDHAVTEAARPALDISGEVALRPDLLNHAVPGAGTPEASPLPGTPANASDSIEHHAPAPGQPVAPVQPPRDTGTGTPRSEDGSLSKTEIVEHFYRLIPTWPDKAFALLDRALGTSLGDFVQSWSSVRDVEVLDVRDQGDDVLAVIRMLLPDGTYLRVQQLLDVTNTAPRRIVGAEILSAQRN